MEVAEIIRVNLAKAKIEDNYSEDQIFDIAIEDLEKRLRIHCKHLRHNFHFLIISFAKLIDSRKKFALEFFSSIL